MGERNFSRLEIGTTSDEGNVADIFFGGRQIPQTLSNTISYLSYDINISKQQPI